MITLKQFFLIIYDYTPSDRKRKQEERKTERNEEKRERESVRGRERQTDR